MPTPAPFPPAGGQTPPVASGGGVGVKKKEPEIVVIPDKFYGVALKLNTPTAAELAPKPASAPPPAPVPVKPVAVGAPVPPLKHSPLPIILIAVVIFLAIGGGFLYFSRDLLFKKKVSTPVPVATPPVATPPSPANLNAIVSGSAVALNWVDTSGEETGYRLERKETDGSFLPLSGLPANSNAFLDSSVQPGKTYVYRVIAVSDGGESSPSNEASSVITAALPPLPATPTLPPGGLDSDSDGVSDLEEPLYGTDLHNPDMDNDGFLDGNEVFHLYNPAAKAPVRLLDSGLVKALSAPAGWSIYVPATWTSKLDKIDGSKATITTGHGETFGISLEDNSQKLALMDWYLAQHPGVLSSSVRPIMTKGGLEGILGIDRLEAFFLWGDKVFVLKNDLAGQSFVNFRTTFEMMLNSLKLVGAPVVTPPSDEAIGGPGALVGAPSSTTPVATSTEAVPVSASVSTSSQPTTTSTGS